MSDDQAGGPLWPAAPDDSGPQRPAGARDAESSQDLYMTGPVVPGALPQPPDQPTAYRAEPTPFDDDPMPVDQPTDYSLELSAIPMNP